MESTTECKHCEGGTGDIECYECWILYGDKTGLTFDEVRGVWFEIV